MKAFKKIYGARMPAAAIPSIIAALTLMVLLASGSARAGIGIVPATFPAAIVPPAGAAPMAMDPATAAPPPEGAEQLILSLTYPDQPGVLIIQHHKGTINIAGYDGSYVVVNASLRYPDSTGMGGVRPVGDSALRFNALEKNNVVTVYTNSHERTIDLDIQVPRNFSVHIEKLDSGGITVFGLSGEMDVSSNDGDVQLTDISGSAVVSTVDGTIVVKFLDVNRDSPMAFTSVGGNINVQLPEDIDANVRMRTDHGEIKSDFDIDVAPRAAESGTSGETGIQRAFLERWTYGTLGDGGAEIVFRSYSGNITIRKSGNLSVLKQ